MFINPRFYYVIMVWALTLSTNFACAEKPSSRYTDQEFDQYLTASKEGLAILTEANEIWGLGQFERWDFDQDVGNIIFSNSDRSSAKAPAQIIGTFNTSDNTWLWAWANSSVNSSLIECSRAVRSFGQVHGLEKLTDIKWIGSDEDVWDMAALAVKICDMQGAYWGPAGSTKVLFVFGEVTVSSG